MANQLDLSSQQIQTETPTKIVTFSGSKIASLGILSMIIVLSLFISLLWSLPEFYFVLFGAFILSPIVVLGLAKLKSISKKSNSFSLSKVFVIVVLGIFVYLNVYHNKTSFTLIMFGFFINSFFLTAWTLIPYSTIIESHISRNTINLIVKHKRLLIGTSITHISIKRGEKVTLKPNNVRQSIFSKSFVFHHLQFWKDGRHNVIPFVPFSEKGIQLAAKMQIIFMNSDCSLIIDSSLLNSKNLFMKLIIPKVSTRYSYQVRSREEIFTPKKMVIESFSTFEETDKVMYEVNPNDLSILSIENFVPLLSDPKFKKSRLVSIKKLLVTLFLGLIYFMFGLLIIYVSSAVIYVVFLRGWYVPFIIQLYLTLILLAFLVMFFFQGIIYPLFLLFGYPNLTYKPSEFPENTTEEKFLLLEYRMGFSAGLKIKLPTVLETKIIVSNKEYSLVVFLDNQHHLQLSLGSIN